MILMPDLFSFAYVPNWYSQLDMLAEMSLPEPWRFKNLIYLTKNPDTPILERYIHAIFKKQLIDYKDERNPSSAADYFHIENEFCCFHTGLYTRRYKAIYACFDRNKKKDSLLEWYFRGFADELSPILRHTSPLPKKPSYYMTQYGVNYNPEWPIRVNVDHILGDEENLSRIPAEIREAQNLPLLLETAVELARRKAVVEPSIVVPQGYQGRVQYLLPICLTDMEQPDLAMTGELTLTGKVMPIGGLKEKILAARRNLIKEIIIPQHNMKDLEKLDAEVKGDVVFHPVSDISEVISIAFPDEGSKRLERSILRTLEEERRRREEKLREEGAAKESKVMLWQ